MMDGSEEIYVSDSAYQFAGDEQLNVSPTQLNCSDPFHFLSLADFSEHYQQ